MRDILNPLRWKRRRLEKDLARELRYHVERSVADLASQGVSENEARRRVAIELGAIPQMQEEVRDTWMVRWCDAFVGDARFAVRGLTKSWTFTLGAGAMIALGIGANTAIFSMVNAVLLRPLPYPDAGRIVSIETLWTSTGQASPDVSGPDFLDWQAQNHVFEVMAHSSGEDDAATVVGGQAEFANFRQVSSDFFKVFDLPPVAGQLLPAGVPEHSDQLPLAPLVVVNYQWALRHFSSAQSAVGTPIRIFGQLTTIAGVAAPGFDYPGGADLWVRGDTSTGSRNNHNYQAVGKLKRGVTFAEAQTEMRAIGGRLAQTYPDNRLKTVALTPLQERVTGNVRSTLWLLMTAVGLVLLIACANVANLLLARSGGRAREIALRAALGAGRGRVVRQLLTESFVLAIVGTIAGVAVAFLLVGTFTTLLPAGLPRFGEIRVDVAALLFALALSTFATVCFGLLPALHATKMDLSDALKQGGAKSSSSGAGRLRSVLVVAEVAVSVVLLTGSGLLLRSFQALNNVDLGYSTERVILAQTQYAAPNPVARITRIGFYQDLVDKVRAVPGVSSAAGVSMLPLGQETTTPIEYFVEGRPEGRPGERPKAFQRSITPGYFSTLRIPIRLGRDFARGDTIDRPAVAIVNETLARAAFPNESPIGKRLRGPRGQQWLEIVGVAGDTRWNDPSQPPPADIYLAAAQGAGSLSLLVRTSVDTASLTNTLRALLHDLNPSVPASFETMDGVFRDSLAYPRFRTQLIGAFGIIAAIMAAVGLLSVLAYVVGQRTRELAIRRAVGASAWNIVSLIAGRGLLLVGVGLLLGLAVAFGLAGLLEGLLYQISPWDLETYVGAAAVLGATAVFATVFPAIRALNINPLVALRQD